jgi:LPXTG-motif cell wall-anchored protein
LATRGTPAPKNEQRCNGGCNSDYYAKFKSVQDSASDKIGRLYNKTMGGVTPEQLKNVKDADEFAELLKRRSYYGFGKFGTEVGNKEQKSYAVNMKSKLIKINVVEFVSKNKNTLLIGLGLLAIAGSFYLYKKNN